MSDAADGIACFPSAGAAPPPDDRSPPQRETARTALAEEADRAIAALRLLWGQVSHPVIQAVLAAARFDIAYLAAGERPRQADAAGCADEGEGGTGAQEEARRG